MTGNKMAAIRNIAKSEYLGVCTMLALSLGAFGSALYLPDSQIHGVGGTSLVPLISIMVMLFFSVATCVSLFLKTQTQTQNTEKINNSRSLIIILSIVLYSFFMEKIGFLLSSFLLSFIVLFLFKVRRIRFLFFYALGISLIAWIVFAKLLSCYLPYGTVFR